MKLGGQIITREEELRLPTYTEFVDIRSFEFWGKVGLFALEIVMDKIQLYMEIGDGLRLYKDFGEMTEENYEEALEEIKKLYKGE